MDAGDLIASVVQSAETVELQAVMEEPSVRSVMRKDDEYGNGSRSHADSISHSSLRRRKRR